MLLKKTVYEYGLDKLGCKIQEQANLRNPGFVCFLV